MVSSSVRVELPMLTKQFVFAATVLLQLTSICAAAARFSVIGPVLTVTLKDPDSHHRGRPSKPSLLRDTTVAEAFAASSSSSSSPAFQPDQQKWLDITALRPNVYWSLQSNAPPLPKWLPFWTSARANVGYKYDDLKRLPSFVEGDLRFRRGDAMELQIQPSYELKAKRTNLLVKASRGASYLLARFSMRPSSLQQQKESIALSPDEISDLEFPNGSAEKPTPSGFLDYISGSYFLQFPSRASISSVRITPTLDVAKNDATCTIEGTTGGAGRTKALLKLNYNNPTLSVVHTLDERNVISPEISLYTAKIIYQWRVLLNQAGTSSIRTRVDPTSAIDVTWVDTSAADGGRWVTDFKLPLEGTTIQALASNVRVRRQFNF